MKASELTHVKEVETDHYKLRTATSYWTLDKSMVKHEDSRALLASDRRLSTNSTVSNSGTAAFSSPVVASTSCESG